MIPYLFIALLFLSCSQTTNSENEINWTKPDLNGHWKLHDTEIVDEVPFLGLKAPEPDPMTMVHEDSPWDGYVEYDLVFENDTMYMIDYPITASRPQPCFVDTGYLHLGHIDSLYNYPVEMINDTLYFYKPMWSDPGFFKETYVRTSFNDSIFNVMKKYGVNYPELAGTWYLVREMDYDYGTHYELQFPHELPDSIHLSREEMINALGKEKIYMLPTDGKKKEYTFYYDSYHMNFVPGNWWKGEEPWIFFSKYY